MFYQLSVTSLKVTEGSSHILIDSGHDIVRVRNKFIHRAVPSDAVLPDCHLPLHVYNRRQLLVHLSNFVDGPLNAFDSLCPMNVKQLLPDCYDRATRVHVLTMRNSNGQE